MTARNHAAASIVHRSNLATKPRAHGQGLVAKAPCHELKVVKGDVVAAVDGFNTLCLPPEDVRKVTSCRCLLVAGSLLKSLCCVHALGHTAHSSCQTSCGIHSNYRLTPSARYQCCVNLMPPVPHCIHVRTILSKQQPVMQTNCQQAPSQPRRLVPCRKPHCGRSASPMACLA